MIQCRVLFLFFVFLIVAIQAELRLLFETVIDYTVMQQRCRYHAVISEAHGCVKIVTETSLSTGTLRRCSNSFMIYIGKYPAQALSAV